MIVTNCYQKINLVSNLCFD